MLFKALTLATCLASVLADTPPAQVVKDNAQGTVYLAPITAGKGPIIGNIQVVALPGQGAQVAVTLNNFDLKDSLEYSYHIHATKVPDNGDCTATAAHFDNRGVTDDFKCDPKVPEQCQLGDLSGKHGAIVLKADAGTAVSFTYMDPYLSTTPGNPAFIGDRSIVIHKKSDKTRLNCGNFRIQGSA